jgi:spermidine synthase
LPEVKNILVLGTGLASMVHVVNGKGFFPDFTLIEKDKVVLQWAMEFLGDAPKSQVEPVCEDAAAFMKRNTRKYSLIFIDIFNSKRVPGFVFTESFLALCRDSLAPGGHLAFNYIINDKQEWDAVQQNFSRIFPGYRVISRSVNKILVI